MNHIKFHARTSRPPVRIYADSPVMEKMLAAVLEPYFSISEEPAALTVLCPEDGNLPQLPAQGKYLVVCNETVPHIEGSPSLLQRRNMHSFRHYTHK